MTDSAGDRPPSPAPLDFAPDRTRARPFGERPHPRLRSRPAMELGRFERLLIERLATLEEQQRDGPRPAALRW